MVEVLRGRGGLGNNADLTFFRKWYLQFEFSIDKWLACELNEMSALGIVWQLAWMVDNP